MLKDIYYILMIISILIKAIHYLFSNYKIVKIKPKD